MAFSFFHKKSAPPKPAYDPERVTPVIRCSICTGEQVAGFKHHDTGRFEEVMLLRNDGDLAFFREQYGITGDLEKIY